MKQKKRFIIKCECGKEIIGFSEKHSKANLKLHKLGSLRHKEVMKLLKGRGIK